MSQHSPEVKAAVLAALMTGQSVTKVAEIYRIPKQTVSRWQGEVPSFVGHSGTERRAHRVGELLLSLLEHTLEKAHGQISHSDDREWLHAQSAEGLAVLFGVTVDKCVRIAEALQPSDEGMDAPAGAADSGDPGGP